jgi:hypothetical protein
MRDDTKMVFELFLNAANRLEEAAADMRRLGERITDDDLSYATEAVNLLVQLPQQCRCDLFAERPRRAMEWRAKKFTD